MKSMLRAALILLFCVILILCLSPSACAESGDWGSLHWSLNTDGLLTISGSGAIASADESSPWDDYPWNNYAEDIITVVIQNGVTGIGEYAFYSCVNLESVTLPSSITSIDTGAFLSCWALDAFHVDTNNKNFCDLDGVLFDKSRKTIVKFPEGRTGSYTIPAGVTTIGRLAFHNSNLTTAIIPEGVTSIGYAAFFASKITSMKMPDSVTDIGFESFSYCNDLTSVILSNNLSSIPSYAFESCESLKGITIPDKVTYISNSAFVDCTNLESITIPFRVRGIFDHAFENCTALSKIYYNGTQLSWDALDIEEGNELFTNAEVVFTFTDVSGTWGNLRWTVDADGLLTISGQGEMKTFRVYNDDGSFGIDLRAWHDCSPMVRHILIGRGVTTIGQEAFSGFQNLTDVAIADTVTVIDEFAFSGCSKLSAVIIPEGVTEIGLAAFEYCSSLKSVMIPKSMQYIFSYAFSDCGSLTDVFYTGTAGAWSEIDIGDYNDALTSAAIHYLTPPDFALPEFLTVIEADAFAGIAAKTVLIPKTVTSIRGNPFSGSQVTTIYGYSGTAAQTFANTYGYTFVSLG